MTTYGEVKLNIVSLFTEVKSESDVEKLEREVKRYLKSVADVKLKCNILVRKTYSNYIIKVKRNDGKYVPIINVSLLKGFDNELMGNFSYKEYFKPSGDENYREYPIKDFAELLNA